MLESASRKGRVCLVRGGLPGRGVCLVQRGICLVGGCLPAWSGGGSACLVQGGLPGPGGYLPGPGGCLPAWSGGVCLPGPGGVSGIPACTKADTLPPCGQTHTCKNITLATTSLRPVITLIPQATSLPQCERASCGRQHLRSVTPGVSAATTL